MAAEVKLPEDWILAKIGDVCLLNPKEKLEDELEIGFMPMTGVPTDYFSACKFESRKWLDAKKGFTQFRNGDAIFAKITPCFENSKAAVIQGFPNGWGAGSTEYYVLRPIANAVNPKLLFALVKTQDFLINGALNMSGSVGHKRVPKDFVVNYSLPFPPLTEQKVIADKLDTLLAQVESTKARLERIPQILKRFRQSVLAAAVSGKLTEEWRGSLEYYQVPQSYDWKWGQVPQLWETDFFPDLVSSRLGKMLDKAKNTGKPTKYLGNINVRWFSFDLENLQEILVSEEEQNELTVKRGDVLICEGGEPGRCATWSEDTTYPIVFQKALHSRVGKRITPQWLAFNLKNDSDNKSLEQLFTGTTIKHLTGKALKKYPLRVPPVEEQTEIVRRVEQLFAYADTIEQQVQNALARVNNLTPSILAKAFRGELTEQWRKDNPDLIRGGNSAEALLEKIKAEREAIRKHRMR
ncbi:restriction endonuclease subunit S [Methylobacter luteus]|uniref:restriction endonuclease subunit S n=1 Tax=Methylobacter luteus TaxID=415 RepID=UPI0003F6C4C2|nr:restriction endonuclease subunit S [Methylobacter luteus]